MSLSDRATVMPIDRSALRITAIARCTIPRLGLVSLSSVSASSAAIISPRSCLVSPYSWRRRFTRAPWLAMTCFSTASSAEPNT